MGMVNEDGRWCECKGDQSIWVVTDQKERGYQKSVMGEQMQKTLVPEPIISKKE